MAITLKIGGTPVGLVGVEGAIADLKKQAAGQEITPRDAALKILDRVKQRNYVPASAESRYLEALEALWLRETREGEGLEEDDNRQIRILGPGCVSCNTLEEMVISILSEHGVPADIEHVRDLDEIWKYGVIQTPALVIGRKVLCSGRLPPRASVEAWLRELVIPG